MWQAGLAVSAVSRGKYLSTDARQILGNMLLVFRRLPADDRCTIGRLVGLPQKQRGIDECHLVSHLSGLNIKTMRSLAAKLAQNDWCDAGPLVVIGNDEAVVGAPTE